MTVVLVCGSRTLAPHHARLIEHFLAGAHRAAEADYGRLCVIHGGQSGADMAAGRAAEALGCDVEVFRAEWELLGRSAGPIRNQRMLDEGQPDLVLAFVDKPLAESKGTADMVGRARKAGVPTYVIEALPAVSLYPKEPNP